MNTNTHEYRAKEGATTQWEGKMHSYILCVFKYVILPFSLHFPADIHSRHKTEGYEYVKEIKKAAVSQSAF